LPTFEPLPRVSLLLPHPAQKTARLSLPTTLCLATSGLRKWVGECVCNTRNLKKISAASRGNTVAPVMGYRWSSSVGCQAWAYFRASFQYCSLMIPPPNRFLRASTTRPQTSWTRNLLLLPGTRPQTSWTRNLLLLPGTRPQTSWTRNLLLLPGNDCESVTVTAGYSI
jgi:hypothetical protein